MQLMKMEDLFKIHNTDARNTSDIIKNNIINATITSPPYYNMKDYGYKGQIGHGQSYEEYLEDIEEVFRNIYDVTKDDGVLWVVIDTFKKDDEIVPLPFDFSNKISEVGWKLQDVIIWNKDKTVPWSKKGQTKNKFEYILLFSKSKDFKYYTDRVREYNTKFLKKWWIRYPERYNPRGKAPEEIWNYDIPTQGSWGNGYIRHFCPLPTDMIGKMIQLTTDENDVILDPFAGSGSVLVQAAYMKRKYIGFELNEKYIEMFNSYLKKTYSKGLKNYKIVKKGKYSQDNFENIILNLRALKFAKTLRNNLKKEFRDIIDLIYVEKSNIKPKQNHKILSVNYRILFKRNNLFFYQEDIKESIKNEIENLINKPPLSKYGIEAAMGYIFNKKLFFKRKTGRSLYLYSNKITHKYLKKFDPNEQIDKFAIVSPIIMDINEEDFE